MFIARNNRDVSAHIKGLRRQGKRVALVPTMGALHPGHLSLITLAKQHADHVVASIFVNPTQFGPKEDFKRYPRGEKADLALLEGAGVDAVFLPSVKEIYPKKATADIKVKELAKILCGAFRPGHFDGVATVVKRLFEIVEPDVAIFGEKDFQQLQVIHWLVKTYDIPVEIIGAPIMREADGLAMSSRNAYLSENERKLAPELYRTLDLMRERLLDHEALERVINDGEQHLTKTGFRLDYLEIRTEDSLEPAIDLLTPARIFVAAHLGKTRLIDNLRIE